MGLVKRYNAANITVCICLQLLKLWPAETLLYLKVQYSTQFQIVIFHPRLQKPSKPG